MADQAQMVQAHNFYSTLASFEQVELMLLETGGELTEPIQKLLDSLEADFDQLTEYACRTIREYELLGKSTKEEVQRLQHLARSRERLATSVKGALTRAFIRREKKKVHTPSFQVTLTKSPLSVEVEDGAESPASFLADPLPLPPLPDDPAKALIVLKLFTQSLLERTRSLDKNKVKEVWQGHKEYYLTLFTDAAQYRQSMQEHGKMTKEDLAAHLANLKLPKGIKVKNDNYHLRIS